MEFGTIWVCMTKNIAPILVMVHIISPDGYFLFLVVGMKVSLSKKL